MSESHTFSTVGEMSRQAADLIAKKLAATLAASPTASFVLAGGSTPKATYAELARRHQSDVAWERVHLFWGDERCVPIDSPESNSAMARDALISKIPIPPQNIHWVRTELPPAEAAADYERQLRHACGGDPPRLDMVLLGMGPDGHTASLFPGSPALSATKPVTDTPVAPREPRVARITMTLPLLNGADVVLFLIAGSEKLPIYREIFARRTGSERYPAALVRPRGRLVWFVQDESAPA